MSKKRFESDSQEETSREPTKAKGTISRLRFAAIAVGICALVAASFATPARADFGDPVMWGCPLGSVCMYTEAGQNVDQPEHTYYDYGYHQLTNEWGRRWIFNYQYSTSQGSPAAFLCTAPWESACDPIIPQNWPYILNGYFPYMSHHWIDIGPYNYIRLTPSGG